MPLQPVGDHAHKSSAIHAGGCLGPLFLSRWLLVAEIISSACGTGGQGRSCTQLRSKIPRNLRKNSRSGVPGTRSRQFFPCVSGSMADERLVNKATTGGHASEQLGVYRIRPLPHLCGHTASLVACGSLATRCPPCPTPELQLTIFLRTCRCLQREAHVSVLSAHVERPNLLCVVASWCRFLPTPPGVPPSSGQRLLAVACGTRGPSYFVGW